MCDPSCWLASFVSLSRRMYIVPSVISTHRLSRVIWSQTPGPHTLAGWVVVLWSSLSWFGLVPLPHSPCQRLCLGSSGQSTWRCCQRLRRLCFTSIRQLNSSCANTYTLKQGCSKDLMLETRVQRFVVAAVVWRAEIADVNRVFQGRAAVGSDGAGPAEPKWTLGSAFRRVCLKAIVPTSCLETTGGHLVTASGLSCRIYHHWASKILNLLLQQQLLIYFQRVETTNRLNSDCWWLKTREWMLWSILHKLRVGSVVGKIDLLFIHLTAKIGKSHNSVHWGD